MGKWGSLILLITVMLNIVVVALSLGNDTITNDDYSGFYFIHQWLPSYCTQKGKRCCYPPTGKPPADFTIYGLWAYQNNGESLSNCPGPTFDVHPIKPLEETLKRNWPSFTCPQIGKKFWLHEWNKRGTCSKSVLDLQQYFQTAIDLKERMDIFQALEKAEIKPNGQLYPLEKIKETITEAVGSTPIIYCNQDGQGNHQIWQVVMCVDRNGKGFINCPGSPTGPCATSDIKFPPY